MVNDKIKVMANKKREAYGSFIHYLDIKRSRSGCETSNVSAEEKRKWRFVREFHGVKENKKALWRGINVSGKMLIGAIEPRMENLGEVEKSWEIYRTCVLWILILKMAKERGMSFLPLVRGMWSWRGREFKN